jgi:hypothetical protein
MAYALIEAEKGFKRIKGYKDIEGLIKSLRNSADLGNSGLAQGSR